MLLDALQTTFSDLLQGLPLAALFALIAYGAHLLLKARNRVPGIEHPKGHPRL